MTVNGPYAKGLIALAKGTHTMPIHPTYPGVYVLELPSSVHTISGVSTANTAFIDQFIKGPVGQAVQINGFSDFQNTFGGLSPSSEASYQIWQFYQNGGGTGYVVRVVPEDAVAASIDLQPQNALMPLSIDAIGFGDPAITLTTNIPGPVTYTLETGAGNPGTVTLVQTGETAVLTVTTPAGTAGAITVAVESNSNCSISDSQQINIEPATVTAINPPSLLLASTASPATLTATVAHGTSANVTWTLFKADGTTPADAATDGAIDAAKGIYTPPTTPPTTLTTAIAKATSTENTGSSMTAEIQVVPPNANPMTLTPSATSTSRAQSVLIKTALPQGDTNPAPAFVWTVNNITQKETSSAFCYTPALTDSGTVDIGLSYTDAAKPPVTHTGMITIQIVEPKITGPTELEAGKTALFSVALPIVDLATQKPATLDLTSDSATVWSITGPGQIEATNGFYEAPLELNATTPLVVTATTKYGTANFNVSLVSVPVRISIDAANPGTWGNNIRAILYKPTTDSSWATRFNMIVQITDSLGRALASESYTALSTDVNDPRYFVPAVNSVSNLVQLVDNGITKHDPVYFIGRTIDDTAPWVSLTGGADGAFASGELTSTIQAALDPDTSPLTKIAPNIFNLLCIPATANMTSGQAASLIASAANLCADQRAFFILDPPVSQSVPNPDKAITWFESINISESLKGYVGVYYPRLSMPDPLQNYRPREVGPSGTMAGIYAATDLSRGVWKAPAGITAGLTGASPIYPVKDSENGNMNPLGLNAIRNFPVFGVVSWGARTMAGADEMADQWKYIPVRRTAEYIENSLFAGLKWVVFEPNAEPLWSSIRLNIDAFMSNLFRQGAFFGSSPKDAYFIQCDSTTTSQYDIDNGVVNIIVGFAPLKPAEFVVLQLAQIAGASAS